MRRPAARAGDYITCDKAPGVTEVGVVFIAESRTLVNGRAAARAGDTTLCSKDGELSKVKRGSLTVRIGGQPAARRGDITEHRNQRVSSGSANVYIGDLESTLADCPMVSGGYHDMPEDMRERRYAELRRPRSALRGPTSTTYQFPGSPEAQAALVYEVTIEGKTFTLIAAASSPWPKQMTPEQAADALATLSDVQRAQTNTVVLSPTGNPDDDYWKGEYHDPKHESAAVAGGGVITIFPAAGGSQGQCDDYMQHEAVHNIDNELFWKDPANQEAWERAAESDGRPVSPYGESSPVEDFAESVKMYNLTKGTPCEAKGRERFPARYAELDRLFGATPSPPPPSLPASPPAS